jgi:hypothetical protein
MSNSSAQLFRSDSSWFAETATAPTHFFNLFTWFFFVLLIAAFSPKTGFSTTPEFTYSTSFAAIAYKQPFSSGDAHACILQRSRPQCTILHNAESCSSHLCCDSVS